MNRERREVGVEKEEEEEEEEEEETMAGSSGLPPHSRLLAREGRQRPTWPPFISDTCHLAPKLHQKWTEPHQNGSKIKMHQQNFSVSILMPHADHRAS